MFKRAFWLIVGAGFGFGVSFWLMRFVRETTKKYSPENVTNELAGTARRIGTDLKEALAEGRVAMREREAQIRADLAERRVGADTASR